MNHTWKNGSLVDKCVTLCKMGHTGKTESHLEEWVTLGKVGHFWKNGSLLEKTVYTWKNGSHLEKCFTLGNLDHTWKNGSHFEKWFTLANMDHIRKNGSHLEKWITVGKVGHTWENGSHLEKWVTLGKMGLFISCVHASSNSCYSSWACCQIFLCLERHRNEEKRAIYTEVSLSPRLSFKPLITVITAIEQKYYRHAIMAFKCMTWCAPGSLFSNYVQRAIITKPSIKRRTPRC